MIKGKVLLISLIFAVGCGGCGKNEVQTDSETYGETIESMRNSTDIQSEMMIFPDEKEKAYTISDYRYLEKEGIFDGTYQLSLVCDYNEKEYEQEKQRLEDIKVAYKDKIQTVLSGKQEDSYLTYVTIYDNTGIYEYAMADEENKKIVYVFSQLGNLRDIVEEKYIVEKVKIPEKSEKNSNNNKYNMYYFPDETGGGEIYVKD